MAIGRRAQVWRHAPSFRRPRHFHQEPELNLVMRGSAWMGVGDQRVELGAGQALFFHPGQDHELLEASADLELYVLALRPELWRRARTERAGAASGGFRLAVPEMDAVLPQLRELGHVSDTVTVESQLSALFGALTPRSGTAHVLTRRAIEWMNVDKDRRGFEIAAELRVDPSHLSRRFHRDVGLGLAEFRSRSRLMDFVRLVDAGQPLTHAALSADFGSYAQCHRVFRRLVGCSPSDYFAGERRRIDAATSQRG